MFRNLLRLIDNWYFFGMLVGLLLLCLTLGITSEIKRQLPMHETAETQAPPSR